MAKFKYKKEYTDKNFRSEFIISCLQVPKSQHRNIAWAKEMKIMNDLVKKCDNPEFWFHARTEFQIPSLAWFLTENGRKYLNDKYKKFNLDLKNQVEVYEIHEEKQGEDQIHTPKKIKTIMDFIKKN
jgi:hypothetical protein